MTILKTILGLTTLAFMSFSTPLSAEETKYYSDAKYTGDIVNGKRHGSGEMRWNEGDWYIGDWKNDKRTGYGVYAWPDGNVYKGQFVNNQRNGFGSLFQSNNRNSKNRGNRMIGEFVTKENKVTVKGYATLYVFSYQGGSFKAWCMGRYENEGFQLGACYKLRDGSLVSYYKNGTGHYGMKQLFPLNRGEAQRFMTRGRFAMEDAKKPVDYWRAVKEFIQAVQRDPEWADAWYNLGVALEKIEDYRGAMVSYRNYLKNSSNPPDKREIEQRIFGMEYRTEQQDEEVQSFRGEALRR